MGNAAGVLVGTGKFYGGVTGTALPTTAGASLNAAFKDLGLLSEDGVTQSIAQDVSQIKAWDGSVVRKVQTSHDVTYKFLMLETNPASIAAYYSPDNFDDVNNKITITSDMNTRQSWIMQIVDGSNIIRVVIPDGEVEGHDDVVFKSDTAIGYGITLTAYPDAANVKAYQYLTTAEIS